VSDILTAISDNNSLRLFNTVAVSSGNTDILITKLGLTKKQYYSRMSALTNAGLISRSNGKYFHTSFGKVVYEAQLLIEKAKQNYWKLRAIDSVISSARGMSHEERSKIMDTLIVEDDLKEILLGRRKTNLGEKRPLTAPDQKQQSQQPLSGINNM